MGKKTELLNLPTRLLLVEMGSKKRWKRIVGFGAVAGVILGGATIAVVRVADTREAAALEGAWTDLNACLLGAPLANGETPASRAVHVQLAVVGTPKDKRAKAGELAWPASCAAAAFSLAEHAPSAPEKGAELADSATALAKAAKADSTATADLGPLVDKLWADAAASKLKLGAAPAAGGFVAPKPATALFTNEALAALPKFLSGNFSLSSVQEAASNGADKLYFLVDQKDALEGPAFCSGDGSDTVRCAKVPPAAAKASPGLRLWGTTEEKALPFYFTGDRGQLGIYSQGGKDAVASVVAYGASARADGSLYLLAKGETKDIKLVVAKPTGAPQDVPGLASGDFESSTGTGLLWDWLVYKSPGKPGHLFAKKLPGENAAAGMAAPIDIGEIDDAPADRVEKEALVTGCRSDEATAVRLHGQRSDWVALYAAGRWASPARAGTRGGALTCHGVEAVATQVSHVVEQNKDFAVITQSRCTSSGCTTAKVNLREAFAGISEIAPADPSAIAAADLGGKLLVVWNGGYAGGVRMRLAAPERFKDAEDVLLADARGARGLSSVTELRVLPAAKYAIVLMGTTSGVRALRIDASGKVTPAQSSN
jgi:hypothetical protein